MTTPAAAKSVCLVVQNEYPADTRIRKYATLLRSRGHQVTVIASRFPGQRRRELVAGVEVHRLPPSRRRGGRFRYLYEYCTFLLLAFCRLNLLDLRRRFDVVHVNTLPDFLVFCALFQKLTGRTIILDMHEVMPEFFMSKYSASCESRAVRGLMAVEKLSMRFADRVITVNHALKKLFEERVRPRAAVEVIMNTADGRVIPRYEKKPHRTFNCIYHGTLTDIYGVDTAIRGFAEACGGDKSALFHIYGVGPEAAQLEETAHATGVEDQVIFHGFVRYQSMWEKMAEMDLGILACKKDVFMDLSFSNKLAEYVFLKIPVVHSNLNSILSYFGDDDLLFFLAGDVHDLAAKIRYAREHGAAMQARAEAAFRKYAAIDWGVMSHRYLQLIENGAHASAVIAGEAE